MQDPSKTEKATGKRRRDERKKGNVFMSKDATSIAVLISGAVMLYLTGAAIVTHIYDFFTYTMAKTVEVGLGGATESFRELFTQFLMSYVLAIAPLFLVCAFVGVGVTLYQTKMLVAFDSIKPKLSKLNPISGFKNLFSMKSLMEAVKGILKISLLLYLIYDYLLSIYENFDSFLFTDVLSSLDYIISCVFALIVRICIAYAVLAAIDVIYQKWSYENGIKMSKQEVKDEHKQLEGDPKVKAKIKQKQRQMALSRMMQQVPKADVIIKNPTHYAVALRYKPDKDNAPIILAMGMDEIAQRIIRIAGENNIEVVENRPLARALYAAGVLYREIPQDLYNAVAEVLVYIYKLKGKIKK